MSLVTVTIRMATNFYGYLRELWWYLMHLVKGSSYAEYYADRMDRIVKKNPNWGLNLNRRFQLDYLKAHGFTTTSTLLDYGCGALAAGVHFVEFLEPGRYAGLDISAEVLREGERRLERAGFGGMAATLHQLNNDLSAILGDKQFDFIWAQSVLTHMPPEDIHNLLRDVRNHMHSGSQLFTSFAQTDGQPVQKQFKDWYFNKEFFLKEADLNDLNVEFMTDWHHPDDHAGVDVMARFTLKGK